MKIKRRTFVLLKIWILRVATFTIIVGGWYWYFHTPAFIITNYQIRGVDPALLVEMEKRLDEVSHEYTLRVIPRGKILTYSSKAITDTVRGLVPEASSISIRPISTHALKITVTTLTPFLRVSDTQAITSDGIIFTTRHDISSYPLITIASSTTKMIKRNGLMFTQMVLSNGSDPTALFAQVTEVAGKITSVIFPVARIVVEETGDVTCFNSSGTSKVIFLQDVNTKTVWSNLVSAIDTDPLKGKLATEKDNLEYLDARYGNKVFFRFSDMAFQKTSVTGILGNHATSTSQDQTASSSAR